MKKFILLFLSLCIFISVARAQVKELELIKRNVADVNLNNLLNVDEIAVYSSTIRTRGEGTDCFIEKCDKKSGSLIFSKKIDYLPFHSIFLDKKIILFFNVPDHKIKKAFLSYEIVSSETGEKIAEKQIMETNSFGIEEDFLIQESPDRSKLLIVARDYLKVTLRKIRLQLYDMPSLRLKEEKECPSEFNGNTIRADAFLIDNTGSILFTYNYLKEKKISYFCGVMMNGSAISSNIEINVGENKRLYSYSISSFETANIRIAGIFADTKIKGVKKDLKPGIFTAEIDIKSASLKNQSYEYLNPEITKQLSEYLSIPFDDICSFKSYEPGFNYVGSYYNFKAKPLIQLDNDYYFIAEQGFSTQSSGIGVNINFDLLVVKITKDGIIKWMKLIPKRNEVASNTSYSKGKYHCYVYNKKLNFIFLDNPKNSEVDFNNYDPKKMSSSRGITNTNVINASIDEDGNMKRNVIYKNEKDKFCILPQYESFMLSENELLIYMVNDHTDKLGTITLR